MQLAISFNNFYNAIESDPRIGISHISLYMALLQQVNKLGNENPVKILRHSIMKLAKINSPRTYHRCIRDLHEFGYIDYIPATNSSVLSKVYLKYCETDKSET